MKYFSMFSGIGGFEYGIERAYQKSWNDKSEQQRIGNSFNGSNSVLPESEQEHDMPYCVGFSEIDKYAKAIYQYHFPEHKAFGDAFNIDPGTIPDFDLLCGGFPCQAFSIAGKRGGFKDTRGTLFFEIARIASAKRPKFLLLENVKGLLSHDNGRTFGTILSALSDLGYFLEWQVLNSKDFGVPQNRERVFIIGHLGGISRGQVFPIEPCDTKTHEGQRVVASCLDANYFKGPSGGFGGKARTMVGTWRTHKDGKGFREISSGDSPAIPARAREDGSRMPVVVERAPLRFLDRNQKNFDGDYAFTVDSSNTSGVKVNQRIRRLTPTECERLQAFPDGWTKLGRFGDEVKEISDSQRYKCLGNSVTTTVVAEVVKRIKQS